MKILLSIIGIWILLMLGICCFVSGGWLPVLFLHVILAVAATIVFVFVVSTGNNHNVGE